MDCATLEALRVCKALGVGPTRHEVLREVSLSVSGGQLAAVLGPSGSGKTTLLNVLGTLDRADSGEVWLGGVPVHLLSATDCEPLRRRHIGFVFQDFALLPTLTAAENVELALLLEDPARRQRRLRALAALREVGLAEHARRFPHELSGGQKQRVGIARALVKRPSLILADEPTANLDSATAFELIAAFRALAQSTAAALLVATHDGRLLDAADRRFALRDGCLSEICA